MKKGSRLYYIVLLVALIASSCAMLKRKRGNITVNGTIATHKPYCGGIKPSPEQVEGSMTPSGNTTYYLKKGTTHQRETPIILSFTTKEDGSFSFSVPKGDYVVLSKEKLEPFEAFKQLYSVKSTYMEYLGDECLQRHFDAPDFILRVQNDTVVQLTYKSRCLTGTNPCIRYTGPPVQ